MEKIIKFLKNHDGYARMKDFKAASLQTRDIARMVNDGVIVKVKPGLYRLANVGSIMLPVPKIIGSGSTINQGIIDVCQAIPEGVICLVSVLEFYGLTTFNPSEIYVAIPNSSKIPKIHYPPVKIFYSRDRFYKPGIEDIVAPHVTIKIYNRKKQFAICFAIGIKSAKILP